MSSIRGKRKSIKLSDQEGYKKEFDFKIKNKKCAQSPSGTSPYLVIR